MTAFQLKFLPDGIELRSEIPVGLPLTANEPSVLKSVLRDANAWAALEELWSDGSVEQVDARTFLIRWARVPDLDRPVADRLGLPAPAPVEVWLEGRGVIGRPSFRIDAVVRHPEHGNLAHHRRSGPAFLLSETRCVVVDGPTHRLLEAVANAPAPDASPADALRYVATCREAARAVGAHEDAFLRLQNIESNEPVAVDVREEDGTLVLSPISGDLRETDLVLGDGRPRSVVNQRRPDGSVRRVVMSEEATAQLQSIGRERRVSGAEVPKLLTNPEALLPEGIDLTLFSKRVTGLRTRVYNSRPYIHVREGPRGWFDVEWGVSTEVAVGEEGDGAGRNPSLTPQDYARLVDEARSTGERFVRHGDDWIEVDPEAGERFSTAVAGLAGAAGPTARLPRNVILEVIPNVDELGFEVTLPTDLSTASSVIAEGRLPPRALPEQLRAELRPHQALGYRWLGHLHEVGGGGLLADEMGVGKTLQVISHLLALHQRGELSPSLLVMPKTLVQNWWEELRRFAPSIDRIVVYDGGNRVGSAEALGSADVVLTTYETVRRDQLLLGKIDWQVVVCDEAQFVKNPTAGRTAAIKALKAKQPIAVTGTPVENGLIEFWCIVDFVQPGRLRSWSEFRSRYERPLAQATEAERRPLVEEVLDQLEPHYLRRLKDEVLRDLPPKEVVDLEKVEPSALQRELYARTIQHAKEQGGAAVLAAIGRLLRICAHPRCEISGLESVSVDDLVAECPKLAQTLSILREVRAAGEKALVFAEWKAAQWILQRVFGEALDFWPAILNGDVNTNRLALVESFCRRPGFGVMVLSPHVAGYGLNIVAANHVIHYTRPWNPAKESQATDRVHRIGQTRPVKIYYPIVRGTAEERLAELLAEKQALAKDVLRPSSERSVSPEELATAVLRDA